MPTDETIVYHLTPGGWKSGVEPHDCVESWHRTVSRAQAVKWICDWVDLARSFEERNALRKKYHAFMV
jgi:hypothetical protein